MLKISIVTPVLNGRQYIRDTVESVLAQRGDFELEYIVRDGGSTDGTLELLNRYRERCRIVSEADGSPQAAINRGMAVATGEIAGWLNGDDLYAPGCLQAVARLFANRPKCRWCYGRCRIIDQGGCEIRKPITWYKNILGRWFSRNLLLCENFINQPATFWHLDLWREIGGLDSSYKAAWDYELWLKMAEIARPRHLPRYLAAFRRHPQSISETHFERQFAEELEIAAARGNRLHRSLHACNRWKITTAYRLMAESKK